MNEDFQEVKERIRNECDLVEVASYYVDLKLKGKYYWGLCPFHSEKTPSFHISQEKQLFYCFGCHTGGDIFHFMEKIERLNFREAFERLAEWANIDISSMKSSGMGAKESDITREIKEVHKYAANFFRYILLNTEPGKKAQSYLKKRYFDLKIIDEFWLGYAPDSWTALNDFLQKKGFSEQRLIEAGLCNPRKKREGSYDRFRDRLMFPIANHRGEIIGFGGRLLEDKEGQPKYLNSPETTIFSKGKILYGLHKAVSQARHENRILILEGYTDVIRAHQCDLSIAVASLGTALTQDQARLIKRYADKAFIAYDADEAGQNSTLRGMDILWDAGVDVKVCKLPEDFDPDEYINDFGVAHFKKEIMENALPLVEFKLQKLSKDKNLSNIEGKKEYIKEVIPVLAKIDNEIEREEYMQKLSRQLDISFNSLHIELSKFIQNYKQARKSSKRLAGKGTGKNFEFQKKQNKELTTNREKNRRYKAEEELLELMLHFPEYISYVKEKIDAQDFADKNFSFLVYRIYQWYDAGKEPGHAKLIDEVRELDDGEDIEQTLTRISMKDVLLPKNVIKFIEDCTAVIRKSRIQTQRKELEKELNQIDPEHEPEKWDEILAKINECIRKEKSVQRTLGEGG